MERGEGIYKEVCFACHGDDGRGTALAGRAGGHDDGAVARELEPRAGSSGLRDQDAAARDGRADRRPNVCRRRDGADGEQSRRVDCGHRVLRPQLFRQRRHVRVDRRRGASPDRDRGPQGILESGRAAGVAPGAARGVADVEGEREPQSRAGARRAELRVVEHRRAAAARDVVPDRAAGAGDRHRSAVQLGGRRLWGRWRRTRVGEALCLRQGRQPRPRRQRCQPGPYPRGYKVEVSTNGTAWTQVAEGQGTPGSTTITFAPTQAKYIRITQTATAEDGTGVVDAAAPVVPGGNRRWRRALKCADLVGKGGDVSHCKLALRNAK